MFNQYPNYSRFILAKYSLDEVDSISFFRAASSCFPAASCL